MLCSKDKNQEFDGYTSTNGVRELASTDDGSSRDIHEEPKSSTRHHHATATS